MTLRTIYSDPYNRDPYITACKPFEKNITGNDFITGKYCRGLVSVVQYDKYYEFIGSLWMLNAWVKKNTDEFIADHRYRQDCT